jgi:dihydrofolate synthase / folylpolyglutamate synthase
MTYEETLQYLYEKTPLYQHIGNKAYKPGLDNIQQLDASFGHPHTAYKTIHVGGTNGKGSVSHSLAAVLQSCGYKVGLYTSPHLQDFAERIRVNGAKIAQKYVIDFVTKSQPHIEHMSLSFFELTTMMALCYFKDEQVDIAIIEVGLGGRLDSTNIITPIASVITNISFDHTYLLGNTLKEIATEKAGIIKKQIPIIIGEKLLDTKDVFTTKASEMDAPLFFAEEMFQLSLATEEAYHTVYTIDNFGTIACELRGWCQQKNTITILCAIRVIQRLCNIVISEEAIHNGLANVTSLTGLLGRWQIVQKKPIIIADTAHNEAGLEFIVKQLASLQYERLHIVLGMADDKDTKKILSLLPKDARYYFTQASIKRALPSDALQQEGKKFGLEGTCYRTVIDAKNAAMKNANDKDVIYIGGSTFVVAEAI